MWELVSVTGPAADTLIGNVELPDVEFELLEKKFSMSSVSSLSLLL